MPERYLRDMASRLSRGVMARGSVSGVLRILAGVLVGATTALVAWPSSTLPAWTNLLIAPGLVVVGLVAAVEVWTGFQSTPWSSRRRRADTEFWLRDLLLLLHERGVLDSPHYYMLSAHVWEVPRWYRRVFPLWLRRRGKALYARLFRREYDGRPALRPTLDLVAYRTDRRHFAPSGIRFRKGEGLLGVVLTKQDPSAVLSIDYEAPEYARLRRSGRDEWNRQHERVTLRMDYDTFLKLSKKYGQAVAVQLCGLGGEAIGALTLEAQRGYPTRLAEDDRVLTMMLEAAEGLAVLLDQRGLYQRR